MIERILIVCVGNICRSPVAEVLLRHELHALDKPVVVESAGLAAVVGSPIHPLARATLQARGFDGIDHVARQITPALINAADLLLVMDQRQASAIHAIAPRARGKTFLLGKWQRDMAVGDPHGKPHADFERAFILIQQGVRDWCTRL
jgi:protein-tyrosine phosphatase